MLPDKFLKPYQPDEVESAIYEKWEKSGYFNPDNLPDVAERKLPYCIIMPPPNANGSLHAGHALFVTLQDILIRYKRMRGYKTLWLPGADHAGFETQVVYEKKLEKEGRSRFGMDPKELYKEILAFTLANKTFMEGQLRQLGASCDWSRGLFTLDERVVKTVSDTFKKLEDDELLYRGARIVNWCPKHQTSLSNLETVHQTRTEPFYYFKYGPFTIGTSRPETKFGDKYVVMHPEDKRYAQYHEGQQIDLEWINGPITATIIKDEAIDREFGTGVMTITPWHDATDFEIAKRHDLEREQIIDWRGKLLPIAGEFAGINIKDARTKIVEKLKEKGLLERVEEKYAHEVPVCYKCEREIEPQVKAQWFIKMAPLAGKALQAVEAGDVHILTEQHEKIMKHWLSPIQDWNISRQVVWGIPIPAKICTKCDHGMVDLENKITACAKCNGEVVQDPDTFDTWFSSGQWPFVTLGFPDSKDFTDYYPTSVMETGADIIFFWVARMIMLGLYRTGKVPFKDVYLHGMVRDAHGKKMSKSKGNVISPLDVSDQYGTDALRMGLIVGNTPGTDLNLDVHKIGAYKKFANKIWNITRFILENTQDMKVVDGLPPLLPEEGVGVRWEEATELTATDQILRTQFDAIATDVTHDIEEYRLYMASDKLYQYIWGIFASDMLETSKPIFMTGSPEERRSRQNLLLGILADCLKLLHPFMPFVTEEIWQDIPENLRKEKMLMIEPWPVA